MAAPHVLAIAGLATSIGTGLMFAAAGAAKLRHRAALEGVVANYRLLPAPLVAPAARLLPWAELAVAAGLLTGVRPWPQAAATALLLTFAAAMAINLRRGRAHIDCGCGLSALRQPLTWSAVVRNLMLATLLVGAGAAGETPGAAAVALAIPAGVALFLFHLIFNAIATLARTSPASMGR